MSLESQLNKSVYCQRNFENRCLTICRLNGKRKTTSNEFKTQFVKINHKNKIQMGCGHSKLTNNNFSRCNSATTTNSSTPSTQTAPEHNEITNKRYNRCVHVQQSCSMPHSNKKKRNDEFTEQRCNYEQVTQQLQQQELYPWPSEEVVRRKVSNSRTPTCSVDKNHNEQDKKTKKFSDPNYSEFMALSEFRMQNRNDCFSDCNHRLLDLRKKTPSKHVTKTSEQVTATLQTPFCEINGGLIDIDANNKNISRSLPSSFSSLSLASAIPMPYAWRQRILRDQLAKDLPHRKSVTLSLDKSIALSYYQKY